MKKILCAFAAVAALTLASCAGNECTCENEEVGVQENVSGTDCSLVEDGLNGVNGTNEWVCQ